MFECIKSGKYKKKTNDINVSGSCSGQIRPLTSLVLLQKITRQIKKTLYQTNIQTCYMMELIDSQTDQQNLPQNASIAKG